MPAEPLNTGQLALLIGAIALFLGGAGLSIVQFWHNHRAVRIAAKSLDYWAIILAIGALVWHQLTRDGSWLPLEDNCETLIALAILLALFSMYMQAGRRIPGLDWFLLPIVVLTLGCAAVFGKLRPDAHHAGGWWSWTHVLSSYIGAAAFAVAAAVGCVYLLLSARLRRKLPATTPTFGSLERLERVTQGAATLGFALLTLGMITGLILILHEGATGLGPHWMRSPKVILAAAAWVVYALALHSPINPTVRGRKSAMLSIFGFVLMFGTLIAVQFVPGGR